MTVPDKSLRPPGDPAGRTESPEARARRIEDLKRRVQSGTYLIQRYEIIEGLLDALSADAQ
ncbi:MAG: flagellar biosynthesis anti-sigma factor FlgM [Solidesulfovibrio sp.]|uniref:flagellar biosynthesis anti-sigma factor FlgM n=1 Tax=Solidesulfovibrio sp. TaxID=2910990 RepID=UPI002B209A45|nr:flagellar biosynthesis anti-sigma factor FlgM [Solidesulfovibrio sp.]MEA4857925.1 flagellar biosynthesis anti-sigma factor FlgM [Solidesulfovibrio sp.]